MSSRIRKDRGLPAGSEEQQLWQTVRTYLRSLEKLGASSAQELSTLEEKRKTLVEEYSEDVEGLPLTDERKEGLTGYYQRVDRLYEDEQREIAKALEKLEVLVAVRDDSSGDLLSKRKKRKTDLALSVAGSPSPPLVGTPAKQRNASPITGREESGLNNSALLAPTPDKEKKRSNSKSNVLAGTTSTPSLQRRGTLTAKDGHSTSSSSSTIVSNGNSAAKEATKDAAAGTSTSSYVDPARARREVLAHQLPLQRGRKVAFRQPSKNKVGPGAANVSTMTSRSTTTANVSSTGSQGMTTGQGGVAVPDDDGETWIMATIMYCINNDRNRYVVQDAEDTAMPTYNTTLKAIVPLPESLPTLPLEDYKVGAQVMGLYPDTSCFYQAIVRGGGPGINGKLTAKMHRRAEELLNTPYRLEFEDDGGAIQNVPACLVVERP